MTTKPRKRRIYNRQIDYLFCKDEKKQGLWLVAEKYSTYSQYIHEDYIGSGVEEYEYLSSLSDEEKKWLNSFLNAYYKMSTPDYNNLGFKQETRRVRYNNHKGTKQDIFTKCTKIPLADGKQEANND